MGTGTSPGARLRRTRENEDGDRPDPKDRADDGGDEEQLRHLLRGGKLRRSHDQCPSLAGAAGAVGGAGMAALTGTGSVLMYAMTSFIASSSGSVAVMACLVAPTGSMA